MIQKTTLYPLLLVLLFLNFNAFRAQTLNSTQDELYEVNFDFGFTSMINDRDGSLNVADDSADVIKELETQGNSETYNQFDAVEISDGLTTEDYYSDNRTTYTGGNKQVTDLTVASRPTETVTVNQDDYEVSPTVQGAIGLLNPDTATVNFNTSPFFEPIFINAGGSSLTHNGDVFDADSYFVGGEPYTNIAAQVPNLYLTERSSPTKQFAYDIPVSDGEYIVKLYFAEIFWGATGKPAGAAGQRIFDVTIEDVLVLDNYDIFDEVGAEVTVIKTFSATVSDGNLNIDFSALAVTGGVNEPKVSAIEIFPGGQFPPIEVDAIVDKNNEIGDTIASFTVSATGGDTNVDFSYEMTGQPEGIEIDALDGSISGRVDPSALTGGPNNDGIYNVLITVAKVGSSDVNTSFTWTIIESESCVWNDLADSGPGRFEALSQAIGDKLYITGGWISRTPPLIVSGKMEIYDTTTDTWSIGSPMPVPVTHMGNTVVGNTIWSVGGFSGNDPGIATDVVQIYDTVSDTWSTGPSLPIPTGSGALVLMDNRLHYFGGLAADRLTDIGNHYVLDLTNQLAGWDTAAPLPNPRNHFSGIGLNGLIYAVGGDIGHDGPVQNTKFLHAYDPVSNEWTRLADLPFERSHFEPGTTVHNGKIIIVGGRQVNAYFDEVTQYDPETNTWSELCTLPEKLLAPAARVFDDRLIVTGGGVNGFTVFSNATRWLQLEPIEEPVVNWTDKQENEAYEAKGESGFVQVGDKFYIVGGLESKNVFSYDYTTDTWADLGEAPFLFNHFQPVEYKGLIWVLGALKNRNYPSDSPIENVWVFNPLNNSWHQGPEVPQDRLRGAAGVVVYNDKFYVIGGSTNGHDGGYVSWLDEFDPQTGQWRMLPDAPHSRDHFYAVHAADKLYAIGGRLTGGEGGFFGPDIAEVDVFDFNTETWQTLPETQNLPTPRAGAPVAFFENQIMVMGGEIDNATVYGEQLNRVALQVTEGYDINSNSWSRLTDTTFPRHATNAIVSGTGVYLASGFSGWGASPPQQNMEFYGSDSPSGQALVESEIAAPESLFFTNEQPNRLTMSLINGNTGILVKSMEILGQDASDFQIVSGNLTNQLVLPNSQFTIDITLDDATTFKNATLRINHDLDSFTEVLLTSSILMNLGSQTNTIGESVSIQMQSEISSSNYIFSAENLPDGLLIDENSGVIAGTITGPLTNSPYNVTIEVTDGVTLQVLESVQFQWFVYHPDPLTVDVVSDQSNEVGDSVNIALNVLGGDDTESLEFVMSGAPDGVFIDLFTGTISGEIASTAVNGGANSDGDHSVLVNIARFGSEDIILQFNWMITESATTGVIDFILVDATTGQDILVLQNDMEINATQFPNRSLSIRMETIPSQVGSVSAELSGAYSHTQTENFAPYALFGDNGNGTYNGVALPTGAYVLTAIAFTESGLAGIAYPQAIISFSIVEPEAVTYEIVSSAGIGGSISPIGSSTINEGSNQEYSVISNSGYAIMDVLVDGISQGAVSNYTFTNIISNHTIEAVFETSTVSSDSFWLEAECAVVGSGWSVVDDPNASNGQYLSTPPGNNFSRAPTNESSMVRFEFQADARQYSIYTLVQAGSLGDDSFWVRANGGGWVRWNFIAQSPTFIWDRVADTDDDQQPVTFDLVSGFNSIDIAHREDGILFDKLYVTSGTELPTGQGGIASNCVFVSQPPVADAGAIKNVILPIDNVVLAGTGSDPDGGAITDFIWTQQSGPSIAILSNSSTPLLAATGLELGEYVFRLTVTDDEGDSGFDEVIVVVSADLSDSFWLEAECAVVGSGWSVVDDPNASNGQYLSTPPGNNFSRAPTNESSMVRFEFQADAGQYSIYTLVQAGSLGDDSFWVRANGGGWVRWNFIAQSPTFIWDRVADTDDGQQPVTFYLVSGLNTIDIAHREDGILIDKLYVTSGTELPTGQGGNGGNCSSNAKSFVQTNNKLELSPNPSNSTTTLSFEKPVRLMDIGIYDVLGRLVVEYRQITKTSEGNYLLSVEMIPSGTYFLKSRDTNGNVYQKMMVIKK